MPAGLAEAISTWPVPVGFAEAIRLQGVAAIGPVSAAKAGAAKINTLLNNANFKDLITISRRLCPLT